MSIISYPSFEASLAQGKAGPDGACRAAQLGVATEGGSAGSSHHQVGVMCPPLVLCASSLAFLALAGRTCPWDHQKWFKSEEIDERGLFSGVRERRRSTLSLRATTVSPTTEKKEEGKELAKLGALFIEVMPELRKSEVPADLDWSQVSSQWEVRSIYESRNESKLRLIVSAGPLCAMGRRCGSSSLHVSHTFDISHAAFLMTQVVNMM